jgi:hypothetical protein
MGSARCVPFEIGRLGLLFGTREVPGSRAAWPIVLRGHLRIVGPLLLSEIGGAAPGIGYLTIVIWLLVKLVVSSLLGRNQQPTVPGVQDPNSSPEPSVKRVVGAGCLADGRIGTHMVPWGWPWD